MSFTASAVGTKDRVVAQLRKYNCDPFGAQIAQLIATQIEQDSKIEKPEPPGDGSHYIVQGSGQHPSDRYENAYVVEISGHRGGNGTASNLSVNVRAHSVPVAG